MRYALLLVCLAGQAQAAERKVLVFPLEGPPELAKPLTTVVGRAAGLVGAEITISGATFGDASALAGCGDKTPECIGSVAQAMNVEEVVLGWVEPPDPDGKVRLMVIRYLDGKTNEKELRFASDQAVEKTARDISKVFLGEDEPPPPPPEPPKPPPPPPTPPPVKEVPRRQIHPALWGVAGGGVLLVGAGVFFFTRANAKQDEVNRAPTNTAADFERLVELEDEGKRLTTISNVLLISGAAVTLVGGGLIVYQGFLKKQGPVAVKIAPTPGGATVRLELGLP